MEQNHTSPSPENTSGSQAVRLLRQRLRDGTLKDVFKDWQWI